MAIRCLLIEVKAYSGSAEVTRYLSTNVYNTGPAETPASQVYEPRLIGDLIFTYEMSESLSGQTSISWGGIEIENGDGALDSWINDGWDGRDITLKLGDPTQAISTFSTIMTGKVSRLAVENDSTLTLYIRDRLLQLDIPIQSSLLTSGERINEPKPLCMGKVRNIEPILINPTQLIYQVHDGSISQIEKVYDGGVLLNYQSTTLTSAISAVQTTFVVASSSGFSASGILRIDDEFITYTSVASNVFSGCVRGYASTAAAHSAGAAVDGSDVVYWPEAGEFILGATPVYAIACDAKGALTGSTYIEDPGELMRYIVSDIGPLADPGDLDTTALAALDTAAPYPHGIYLRDRQNMLDVLEWVASSIGAWFGFNRSGDFTCGVFTAPSGTADYDITADDIVGDIEIEVQDVPRWRSRLGYQRHWMIQTRDQLATSVTSARASELAEEYRVTEDNDTTVQTKYLTARDPEMETSLIDVSSDADAEVQRRQTLYGVQRFIYSIECYFDSFTLELGDVVSLTDDRYSLSATKFRVIGIEEFPVTGRVRMRLWK